MTPIDWLYGAGISIALTAALVFLMRALHTALQGGEASRVRSAELRALLDERDRLLLNLRELDFDHQMRKVSDADREALRGELRSQLAEVLPQIEGLGVDLDMPSASDGEFS